LALPHESYTSPAFERSGLQFVCTSRLASSARSLLDISLQGRLDAGRGQYIVKFPSKIRYAVAGCPFQPWRADTRNKVSTHNLCEIKAEFQLIRKMQFGFGLVLAILFIVGGLSYRSVALSRASDKSVEHTHEVLENLERLLSAIQDIESSDRTLALTGDAQFLYLYRAGVLRVSQEENTLRTLTADNPNQGRRLVALARLTDQKIQFGETLIRLRQTEGQEVAIQHLQGSQGIRIMEEIRAVIRDMEAEEHQLLSKRDAEAERRSRQARFVLVAGSLLGLFIASGAGWTIRRGLHSRARVEEALQGSDEKYRMLIDGIQDYAIYMLDPDGQIISWNAGAERIKGYTAEQIIGQNFSCFYPPDEIKRGKPAEVLRMTAASGRQEEQGMRVRKDGSRFLANVTLTALRDRAGNLRGYSEFSHDLSESKESGARYRGLLEAAPDAMVVVNQGGEIVLLNVQAEKQFGYRRDELLGQKVKNIIPEGFAERLIADGTRSAADALAQQIGTGIELSGRRKDGSEFPIEIMLSPLESAEGILVTAAIRDITRRKNAEATLLQKVEELNRSNEELGQFANIASHDLQEPLRMVASYTQLLSSRYKGKLDADADEFIAFAVDGATRMQRLIQDLLAYSRVGSKGRDLLDTSSEKALQQALLNLSSAIKESGALVTHDPLPTVQADEMQLVQLFQNLIGNGIKYQRPGVPQVHISAAKNGAERWIFSVRDNGLGIDSQYFEKIFGMFQRLHKREEFAGTGIGLAICKKIVERHGGNISVESKPGRGSTFRFALAGSGRKS
jgi:PAS domain S-box-containing protein